MTEHIYSLRKQSTWDKTIVEFTGLQEGTVVQAGWDADTERVGEWSSHWVPHTNPIVWKDIPETLLDAEDDAHAETTA